jgi:hypothetical protein
MPSNFVIRLTFEKLMIEASTSFASEEYSQLFFISEKEEQLLHSDKRMKE